MPEVYFALIAQHSKMSAAQPSIFSALHLSPSILVFFSIMICEVTFPMDYLAFTVEQTLKK